ncbi:hypothetical protein [Mangrovibacterium diazotrophicum]|uniref:hypothetical protein n=1 Tax=Mangrovibacterium diazotrophicum TaxID=1261403 RepID=UPI000E740392|nr:hypothetical protein [Mangrovibacterium diazotrophicum]
MAQVQAFGFCWFASRILKIQILEDYSIGLVFAFLFRKKCSWNFCADALVLGDKKWGVSAFLHHSLYAWRIVDMPE